MKRTKTLYFLLFIP